MFCRSLFVLLYFFFWSLCCLFFDIRFLIAPLVSSNSSKGLKIKPFLRVLYVAIVVQDLPLHRTIYCNQRWPQVQKKYSWNSFKLSVREVILEVICLSAVKKLDNIVINLKIYPHLIHTTSGVASLTLTLKAKYRC